ncbi:Uncharacterized protein K02A2.6 [Eumeta japonica]|uniref:Uncharacterized protein K02A2.6 n=1 Tax=Eumeta variegata TaxID=151549 RepID=A0A4C1YP23_EUMVA|nr:Uncharacterized protein K02A2.6 [Eumeta japonica]
MRTSRAQWARARRCARPPARHSRPGRTARPWERVHLDMLSVAGGTHLVVVDAHSKWVEWAPLADGAGTEPVLRRLSEMLGRFGLPRTIVTDNATPFTSARFRRYCEVNDIKHVTIPPYHPASNGQAEITVKLIKRALKTLMSETNSVSSLEHQVNKYLLSYRNSVHSTTGVSPAQLMLGRNVRTRLDLLCPRKDVPKHVAPAPSAANLAQSVSRSQISQSKYFGGKRKINFTVGDKVIVKRHYQNGNKYKWLRGTLVKDLGSRVWLVRTHELTQCLKKHVDQLLHWRGGDDAFIQDTPRPPTSIITGTSRTTITRS